TAFVFAFFGDHITDPDVLESLRASKGKVAKPGAKQNLKMVTGLLGMMCSIPKKLPQLKHDVIDRNQGDIVGPLAEVPLEDKFNFTLKHFLTNMGLVGQYHAATFFGSILKSMLLMKALNAANDESTALNDHNLLTSSCNDVVSAEIPSRLRDIAKAIQDKEAFGELSDEEALEVLNGKGGSE